MSPTGSKILPFPSALRRSEQTGIIQRNFPARWLALLLAGSVGAAWAFTPSLEQGGQSALTPVPRMVLEGDPLAASQLAGSLFGEAALSPKERSTLASAQGQRVVLESREVVLSPLQARREKSEFLRMVEELEGDYMLTGQYPAVPTASSVGAKMTYRTDGQDFTLSAGSRNYTASTGVSYGVAPPTDIELELKGTLSSKQSGWGPWRKDSVEFQARSGVENADSLQFLEQLPTGGQGTARLFFPVDRKTCGYLFTKEGDETAYHSGELVYDSVSGNFSLKLYRSAESVAAQDLEPAALEKELAYRDMATVLVGETGLLADLGLLSTLEEGEQVVALSTDAVLPCSASTALDGLRLSTLERHKEVLPAGPFLPAADSEAKATLVGKLELIDKLGQQHVVRLRGGRGVNYDWIVGQVCPREDQTFVPGFVDSLAASYERVVPAEEQVVRAGR